MENKEPKKITNNEDEAVVDFSDIIEQITKKDSRFQTEGEPAESCEKKKSQFMEAGEYHCPYCDSLLTLTEEMYDEPFKCPKCKKYCDYDYDLDDLFGWKKKNNEDLILYIGLGLLAISTLFFLLVRRTTRISMPTENIVSVLETFSGSATDVTPSTTPFIMEKRGIVTDLVGNEMALDDGTRFDISNAKNTGSDNHEVYGEVFVTYRIESGKNYADTILWESSDIKIQGLTDISAVTSTPILTDTPNVTKTPVPTKTPKITNTPTPTKTTKPTDSPKVMPVESATSYLERLILEGYSREYKDREILELTKEERDYLRNGQYAMEGKIFSSSKYANYFNQFSWYTPISSSVKLSYYPAKNVEKIKGLLDEPQVTPKL